MENVAPEERLFVETSWHTGGQQTKKIVLLEDQLKDEIFEEVKRLAKNSLNRVLQSARERIELIL